MFIKCTGNPIINTYNVIDIDKSTTREHNDDRSILFFTRRDRIASRWTFGTSVMRDKMYDIIEKILKVRMLECK